MGGLSLISQPCQPLPRRLQFVKPRSGHKSFVNAHFDQVPVKKAENPFEIALTWSQSFGSPAGLHNLGNTCFLNSILQCLTHTPPLANYILGHQQQTCRMKDGRQFCFLCFLQSHVPNALRGGQVQAPRALVANLRLLSRSFRPGRQEDAHEFLCKCFESLAKSCQPKLIEAIFGGRFRSQVQCQECNHPSDSFDPFHDIALDIFRANSVTAALRHFTMDEVLSGNNKYLCGNCKKRVIAHKRLTVDRAPAVLTVQMKRFTYSGAKINKPVQYEHRLDLSPFLSNAGEKALYNLFGIVVHIGGGPRSGHYVAYVKSATGIWYLMDDSSARKIGADAVLQQKPYLLFYLKDSPEIPRPEKLPNLPSCSTNPTTARKTVAAEKTVAAKKEPIRTVLESQPGGVAVGDSNSGGSNAAPCSVEAAAPIFTSRVMLPRDWRYHLLKQSTMPTGRVIWQQMKEFRSCNPTVLATWDEANVDEGVRKRILREYQHRTTMGSRSEYDIEYDMGRVRKVKNRDTIDASVNHFQHIVNKKNKKLRSS